MTDSSRGAFEKWARGIGFEDFEVLDEEADELELEYVNDDVELVWCAFAEGERVGWFSGRREKRDEHGQAAAGFEGPRGQGEDSGAITTEGG